MRWPASHRSKSARRPAPGFWALRPAVGLSSGLLPGDYDARTQKSLFQTATSARSRGFSPGHDDIVQTDRRNIGPSASYFCLGCVWPCPVALRSSPARHVRAKSITSASRCRRTRNRLTGSAKAPMMKSAAAGQDRAGDLVDRLLS
jgi:hypothetical protein